MSIYTLKRTKLHNLLKFIFASMPLNPEMRGAITTPRALFSEHFTILQRPENYKAVK